MGKPPEMAASSSGEEDWAEEDESVSSNDKVLSQAITNGDEKEDDAASKKQPQAMPQATIWQVFSFGSGPKKYIGLSLGIVFALVAGAVGPYMVFRMAKTFADLVAEPGSDEFLKAVRDEAFVFLVLGAIAFASLCSYSTCFETAAAEMANDLKLKWYEALLRQDMAYFDIQDVSGTATLISTNGMKYKRGLGSKLGLFFQFIATFVGGLIYAFIASWRISLMVMLTVPFMAVSGWFIVKMTSSQTQRANKSYAEAGAVVYTTVTSIRTVLSLNAAKTMIEKFTAGTEKAYLEAVAQVHWLGLANGSMMGSFLLANIVVPLYGGYLLYDQIQENGCDPSGVVPNNVTCDPTAVDIFGAMFGIFFAAAVLPQISTTMESFTTARAACFLALETMNRSVDASAKRTTAGNDPSEDTKKYRRVSAKDGKGTTNNLPDYVIDSSSPKGLKIHEVSGEIEFHNVTFSYPTRQEIKVFDGLNLKIKAGKTVALVGKSGCGKSTVTQLVERFYDPVGGKITLDGHDLRDINVQWLRGQIGLVGQEPSLFACSIRENIAYGSAGAAQADIEKAAKMANAHDFITSFPDGYNTQVGDKGAKLSGGQKQRIAIARMLIRNPKIVILDEATSALDSESERIVQQAIDKVLESAVRTTIVIAHRLSTVRNADYIAVVDGGKIVEFGPHDELLEKEGHYYSLVQAQQTSIKNETNAEQATDAQTDLNHRTSSLSSKDTENGNGYGKPVVRFRDVKFAYPSRPDAVIFEKLNLSVAPGETVALVGPSGHGKSTVIQLMERFYDPMKGSVELDGVDLKLLNVDWLRSQIGLVSQEPTLFDESIKDNICFGRDGVTQEEIEQAAEDANAHDFITGFPDGYDTQVGQSGTQVSGGQKQRICIARAILRKPRVLLLDEATSALDSESERVVQEALDKIMAKQSLTTIVIAHRLSTIRNASRIAVIKDGKVKEVGTYDELMSKEKGHFRKLQALQSLEGSIAEEDIGRKKKTKGSLKQKIKVLKEKKRLAKEAEEHVKEELGKINKERAKRNSARARRLAWEDRKYFCIGAVGAVLAGFMFPAWGFVFAYMLELLYKPVPPCDDQLMDGLFDAGSCQQQWDSIAEEMQILARDIALASVGIIVAALLGYVLLFYGFGTASERMNRRVRNQAFASLVRQEVSYLEKQSVGTLTSQFQDDAAMLHAFSGEPIRALLVSVASVLVGLVVGFVYMWPFALVFIGILPFMGFGAEMEMRMYMKGEDEGDDSIPDDEHSPGGIVIESLLNMRTVASLTMEQAKLEEYACALHEEDPTPVKSNLLNGSGFGLGQLFQYWGMALMFWFGAWVLNNYPNHYDFRDFVIAMFGLFFSLYGLTVALEGATDREKAKLAADRIFTLTDRESKINPMSSEGIKDIRDMKQAQTVSPKTSKKKVKSSPKKKKGKKHPDPEAFKPMELPLSGETSTHVDIAGHSYKLVPVASIESSEKPDLDKAVSEPNLDTGEGKNKKHHHHHHHHHNKKASSESHLETEKSPHKKKHKHNKKHTDDADDGSDHQAKGESQKNVADGHEEEMHQHKHKKKHKKHKKSHGESKKDVDGSDDEE